MSQFSWVSKTRHIIKTNDAASVWCLWCSSIMSELAEIQVNMGPFWNASKLEGMQKNLPFQTWGCLLALQSWPPPRTQCSPKIRVMMFLCASTAPEQARPSIWRHPWSPLTIQAVPSAVSGDLTHAIEVREKKENSALTFTQRASAWPSCSSSTEASSHPSWGNLFFFCEWGLG